MIIMHLVLHVFATFCPHQVNFNLVDILFTWISWSKNQNLAWEQRWSNKPTLVWLKTYGPQIYWMAVYRMYIHYICSVKNGVFYPSRMTTGIFKVGYSSIDLVKPNVLIFSDKKSMHCEILYHHHSIYYSGPPQDKFHIWKPFW